MPRYKMSKEHRRLVGLQTVSLQRAVDLNRQIADRAAQLEKDLMRDAEGLRKAMAAEKSQYRLRRLEARYLKVMHRLAMVRRAHALAREHGPVEALHGTSGRTVADAIRKALSTVLGIPASLLKGRVKGHWRTTDSGKIVWVQEHQTKRTKRDPVPTAGHQLNLFGEPEPVSAGKPGQEKPKRQQTEEPSGTTPERESWLPPPTRHHSQRAKLTDEQAGKATLEQGQPVHKEPNWEVFDAGEHRWDDGHKVYFVSKSPYTTQYIVSSYNRRTGEYDRAFHTKAWQTKGGAQRYLDRFMADYGSRYPDRGWQKIDSRTGRPVPERKAEPSAATTGTGRAGGADAGKGIVIRENPDWGSVEVKFPEKPSDEIRARLKNAGFRWSGKHGVWYSKRPRAREVATEILGVKKSARRRHPLLGILGGRP